MSIRFLTDNFIEPDVVSNFTVSSENAQFPKENLQNAQRRSKVFRTQGYWEIVSGENTIDFKETSGGGTLQATVTAGNYTSNTTLAAAIKSALEAVGGSTYTVTHESTLMWKIVSDGAGGAGDFEILWTASTDMAAVLGFDDLTDDTGSLTYLADEVKIHTSEYLQFDFGISSLPTSFVLAGPRNEPLKISPSATIKLQANETSNWSTPSFEVDLTYDDENIFEFNSTGLNTDAMRFWRLQVIDQNPLGYIEIGAIYLGDHYTPSEGNVTFPFNSQFVDRSEVIYSEGGQSFSDIQQKTQAFSIEWIGLQKTQIEEIKEIFDEFGTGKPFFVVFDPNVIFSSSVNRMIRYVKFQNEPSYRLIRPNLFSMSMNFLEQL